ncbi:polysaccharide biosynthesis protein [halophilic archaeon]|nr:polysaccharide biosynthesis protein [halophilic archaeon]
MADNSTSFGLETLKGVSAKLAMFIFGFIATAYFARELGPQSFGGFFLLLSVVQFANRVPHGFGGACQKRLAETDTSNEELLGLGLGISIVSGFIAAIFATVGQQHLAAYTGIPNAAPLAIALFVGLSLFIPLQFLLAGKGKFGITNWIDLVREIAKTLLQSILVLLGFGVTGMTAGFTVATLLCLPIILYFLGVRPSIPTWDTVIHVWNYAKFNVPSNVVGKAYTRFDIFFLGWIGLTGAVGYYEVALSLTGLATLISGVVMDGLISRTSNLTSRGRSIRDTVTTTISYTSVLAIPIFVITVFLGDTVVATVYGADYLAAVPFLFGIAIYRIIQTQREPLDSAVKGMGNPDTVFRISSITVAVNVVLGVVGVHAMGASGVLVATIIAELLRCLLLHRALRQNDTVVPLFPDPLRAQFRSAAGMAVALAGLTHVLPNTLKFRAIAGTLSIVTYLTLYLLQDDLARRSVIDFGRAVNRFLTDRELYNQTAN